MLSIRKVADDRPKSRVEDLHYDIEDIELSTADGLISSN